MNQSPILEDGIPVGNQLDKSNLGNPLFRHLVRRFDENLHTLVRASAPASIHEVGCGEGRVSRLLHQWTGLPIRASDYSRSLTDRNIARRDQGIDYLWRPISDLIPAEDRADLVVCCEVLEHIPQPEKALETLHRLDARHYIFSVPDEPLWRILNFARGKYWKDWGNTPGHVNHFSMRSLSALLTGHGFIPCESRSPLPWNMILTKHDNA